MHDENPTPESGGASISERLESFLAADEPQAEPKQPEQEAAAPAEATIPVDEPEEGAQDTEQPQLTTTEFAKVLGLDDGVIDLDSEGQAIVKVKVDGAEGTAKFADVIKSYQLQKHIDNKAREVAEQQKAIQQRFAQAEQEVQARVAALDTLAQAAHQELMRDFQSVDWQWLRENNPGEYAAKYTEFQHRNNTLQTTLAQVNQSKAQAEYQAKEAERQKLMAEAHRIPSLIPEWKDQQTADKERQQIIDWAMKSGATPERVQMMNDAFDVAAYRKAMLYDQLQSSKPAIENKVRTAPKLVKPGTAQDTSRDVKTVQNLKTTIRKSGGKAGVMEYLLATGKV